MGTKRSTSDTMTITVKAPGNPPEVIEGVAGFSMVYIPVDKPETDTNFISGGLNPEAIGEIGRWMIRISKLMKTGQLNQGNMPPLGAKRWISPMEKKVLQPTPLETKKFG